MIDFSFFDPSVMALGDPSLSLSGAKAYLNSHGFATGFGTEAVKVKFGNFVDTQTKDGTYAGKSVAWGKGGAAAILKHKLIVSGKYGDNLDQVSDRDWTDINNISRYNYFQKLTRMESLGQE